MIIKWKQFDLLFTSYWVRLCLTMGITVKWWNASRRLQYYLQRDKVHVITAGLGIIACSEQVGLRRDAALFSQNWNLLLGVWSYYSSWLAHPMSVVRLRPEPILIAQHSCTKFALMIIDLWKVADNCSSVNGFPLKFWRWWCGEMSTICICSNDGEARGDYLLLNDIWGWLPGESFSVFIFYVSDYVNISKLIDTWILVIYIMFTLTSSMFLYTKCNVPIIYKLKCQ